MGQSLFWYGGGPSPTEMALRSSFIAENTQLKRQRSTDLLHRPSYKASLHHSPGRAIPFCMEVSCVYKTLHLYSHFKLGCHLVDLCLRQEKRHTILGPRADNFSIISHVQPHYLDTSCAHPIRPVRKCIKSWSADLCSNTSALISHEDDSVHPYMSCISHRSGLLVMWRMCSCPVYADIVQVFTMDVPLLTCTGCTQPCSCFKAHIVGEMLACDLGCCVAYTR